MEKKKKNPVGMLLFDRLLLENFFLKSHNWLYFSFCVSWIYFGICFGKLVFRSLNMHICCKDGKLIEA